VAKPEIPNETQYPVRDIGHTLLQKNNDIGYSATVACWPKCRQPRGWVRPCLDDVLIRVTQMFSHAQSIVFERENTVERA
jgi:hypothetical protein